MKKMGIEHISSLNRTFVLSENDATKFYMIFNSIVTSKTILDKALGDVFDGLTKFYTTHKEASQDYVSDISEPVLDEIKELFVKLRMLIGYESNELVFFIPIFKKMLENSNLVEKVSRNFDITYDQHIVLQNQTKYLKSMVSLYGQQHVLLVSLEDKLRRNVRVGNFLEGYKRLHTLVVQEHRKLAAHKLSIPKNLDTMKACILAKKRQISNHMHDLQRDLQTLDKSKFGHIFKARIRRMMLEILGELFGSHLQYASLVNVGSTFYDPSGFAKHKHTISEYRMRIKSSFEALDRILHDEQSGNIRKMVHAFRLQADALK